MCPADGKIAAGLWSLFRENVSGTGTGAANYGAGFLDGGGMGEALQYSRGELREDLSAGEKHLYVLAKMIR